MITYSYNSKMVYSPSVRLAFAALVRQGLPTDQRMASFYHLTVTLDVLGPNEEQMPCNILIEKVESFEFLTSSTYPRVGHHFYSQSLQLAFPSW